MNDDQGEFKYGAWRHDDPETSEAAAKSVDTTNLESKVLTALMRAADGLTCYEIAERVEMSLQSTTPRLRPLVRKGFVEDSGTRRETPTGRKAIVWKLTA